MDVIYVKSNIDGKEYLVRNLPDKQQAADLLANINKKLTQLIEEVSKKDRQKERNYTELNLEDIERMVGNYRGGNISESNPVINILHIQLTKVRKSYSVFVLRMV